MKKYFENAGVEFECFVISVGTKIKIINLSIQELRVESYRKVSKYSVIVEVENQRISKPISAQSILRSFYGESRSKETYVKLVK